MRQNRRRNARTSAANHRIALLFSLLALAMAAGALSALSVKSSIAKTGAEISRLESELKTLRTERIRAEAKWSACARPEQLDAALARHGLRMTLARGERIVSLRGRGARAYGGSQATEVAANGSLQRN